MRVLIAWGAFYFRVKAKGENYKLLDADDMEPALRETSRESPSSHEKLAGAENSRLRPELTDTLRLKGDHLA